MPLFEYACKSCDHRFEWLTRGSATPECPSCHGTDLEKCQSVFAARTASPSSATTQSALGACGACGDPRGPGACSINQP
jgi:putative FmdB family regulatory protein